MSQNSINARKIREAKLRDIAARRGLRLTKSRRRDPEAVDYGRYHLLDAEGKPAIGGSPGIDLETIEEYLSGKSSSSIGSIVITYSVAKEMSVNLAGEFYKNLITEVSTLMLKPCEHDAEQRLLNLYREVQKNVQKANCPSVEVKIDSVEIKR